MSYYIDEKKITIDDFKKKIDKLQKLGYKNSVQLFEALNLKEQKLKFSNELGFDTAFIESIYELVNLTRIQWISPIASRMLIAAGYTNPKMVANADANELCIKLDKVNKANKYFKGKIGLRDIKPRQEL